MITDEIREKFQNITSGTVIQGATDHCTKIRNLLCQGFETGPTIKAEFESRAIIKEEQARFLKSYAHQEGLWLTTLSENSQYLTAGGESKIYLASDALNVIKVNDCIYYATWAEYFNSLVIHNLLFPNTAYSLLGFLEEGDRLCVVLEQAFVEGEQADLEDIKELLNFNYFSNIKRQDYYNTEFELLLEDMHDENVIVKEGVLFFIDTVFYVIKR